VQFLTTTTTKTTTTKTTTTTTTTTTTIIITTNFNENSPNIFMRNSSVSEGFLILKTEIFSMAVKTL
jgi:hypothetical protein